MFSPKLVSCSTSADGSSNNHGFRDLQEKAQFIHLVLMEPKVDLWKLRALAISEGGLVNGKYTNFLGRHFEEYLTSSSHVCVVHIVDLFIMKTLFDNEHGPSW